MMWPYTYKRTYIYICIYMQTYVCIHIYVYITIYRYVGIWINLGFGAWSVGAQCSSKFGAHGF